jgi:hypothetical protein
MGFLFLLVALLGLMFPPLAVVMLAMMVLGVFAKGIVSDSQDRTVRGRRKTRRRRGAERPRDISHQHAMAPRPGKVIDVRCYPFYPPLPLPRPTPKSLDALR